MEIEIDFEVYKELTVRRSHEGHSYNEVLRDLLGLKAAADAQFSNVLQRLQNPGKNTSFVHRDGELSDGTLLRAVYKGAEHRAVIRDGKWIDETGREHTSPSAAAAAISQTNVNGLRFWYAKRPTDRNFTRLDILFATQP